jgi:anti-repressor protein
MNELQIFDFSGKGVRITIIDGELWWIARDVCQILGIENAPQAVQVLDSDEKLIYTLHISGQNREVNLINESGLYTLILRSNKPEAKLFRKWVTSEVLPQIRKTGSFNSSVPKSLPEALRAYATAVEEQEKLKQIVHEQQPKVALAEKCLIASNLQSMNDVAKLLNIGRNKLFCFLRNEMILRKDNTER